MNATKRKFNSLIQGIGSRSTTPSASRPDDSPSISALDSHRRSTSSLVPNNSPAASKMSVDDDILAKRRRLQALTEKNAAATNTIKSVGGTGTTKVSNVVPKKWSPSTTSLRDTTKLAPKYAPTDRNELLRRLATFQEITDWTPKPDKVSEIEWAKRGWVCQGKERVRCSLCNKELIVKLNKKEVDGKDVPVLVASDAEEALKEKYADLIVSAHQEDCLWRRRGCDDSLLRLSLTNARASLEALRERYDALCARNPFLPYEFNLRLPDDFSIDTILVQLPGDFFTNPPPRPETTPTEQPNRVALTLAMMGWEGLSNPRIGAVPNSASCHTCLRRLGLWMFKSKEVGPGNEVLVPAPMDHLDPVKEHRLFCPWKNPEAQRWSHTKPTSEGDLPAWKVLAQVIKNDAYLRGALDNRPKSRARPGTSKGAPNGDIQPSTPRRPSTPTTPGGRGVASLDGSSVSFAERDEEENEKIRDAKDKERWARLRRVKSLFETKGGKRLRRTLSRPGTGHSNRSGLSESEAAKEP
ncbi:C3HC zinc finger domain-containing protein [Sodiomyces alkalinus F11]|uniref:C3HC zinc finger domain-containing protein n=1 Tax=Sodiomyces alkalinus (strain CBS 110278 / VKM F-3762 / F11) TaxID=1314773 RepID=A0A3N2PP01_SODAK|nr:C3HC zinc finger domain-containing protein [Sodiomyces alkalinus F11]ROT36223.1 C3HC zinc finger domain-containing protein [Sodiomyces alkalinus F11]